MVVGILEFTGDAQSRNGQRRANDQRPSTNDAFMPLDILALAAHRDDVEQTCAGTLLKMAERGNRTGILDLTQGELGTRGTAEDRAREAAEAARILKVSWRQALDIPDGRVENTWENRLKVARILREQRPRVLILPYWEGRHPDHYTASILGYEAAFISGLAKLPLEGPAHRPFKIIYASLYRDVRPTFVVDITDQFETRFQALMAYKSQFTDQEAGSGIFPAQKEIRARVDSMARFYGMMGGVTYAEPFVQKEIGLVDDVMAIPVKSI
jgi:bacillithiol biosynthesis deacetylase BshB1